MEIIDVFNSKNLTEEERELAANATGPFDFYDRSLDDVISFLKKSKEKNDNIYTFFCGNILYSLFDDEDSCYKKVTGMTKAEYDKIKNEQYPDTYTDLDVENIKRTAIYFDTKFDSLEDAIAFLDKYRKAKRNIYIYFLYNRLYSLLDDKDSCYKKTIGISNQDINQKVDNFEKKYAEIEAKRKENADKNYKDWINKGLKFIYPQKKTDWENCVRNSIDSIYHGKEVEISLKVMESLEEPENNFALAKRHLFSIENNRPISSYGKVVDIVLNYSKYGVEFIRFLEPEKSNKKPLKKLINKIEQEKLKFIKNQ